MNLSLGPIKQIRIQAVEGRGRANSPNLAASDYFPIKSLMYGLHGTWFIDDEPNICLEQVADCLHMVQLMPLSSHSPVISCLI